MRKERTPSIDPEDSRLRILYLYRMLMRNTDESHTLSTYEIIERMQKMHGVSMHRTTLARDIAVLRAAGIDVKTERRKAKHYYLTERPLSFPELRLLIDAVLSSKFITAKKSEALVGKLIALTDEPNADMLRRTVHVTGKAKSDNEKGYFIVDAINEGIHLGQKISFRYFDYDCMKDAVLKNGGKPYTVSPYDLIWDGDFYYLTGYCDERREIRTFRVDRIESRPDILDDEAVPKGRDYKVEKYTQEVFRMYATQETADVRLLCQEDMMKFIIDKFGRNVRTKPLGDGRFRANVRVCLSPTFFRWVFGWDGRIAIEGPARVKEKYTQMLQAEMARY